MRVLLTGGTGFLGEYVLCELLNRGHTVWALYRDESRMRRTFEFLNGQAIGHVVKNLHWVRGDIMGADARWEEWCREHEGLNEADHLLHSAASLRFRLNESGEPFKTNVEGTRVLRDLVSRRPMTTHIVSTAFVCGLVRKGVVYETIHTERDFVNDYERSKWEAENIWMGAATILRPGIIVGHSETGRCGSFTGFYMVAKVLHLLDQVIDSIPVWDRHDFRFDVPADPNGTENLIPVDYVAKAVVRIMENPVNHGRIFHLTHPDPPLLSWLSAVLCRRFNIRGLRMAGPDAPMTDAPDEITRQLVKQVEKFIPYISNNPSFDRANTDIAVPDLEAPPITEDLINMLVDYGIETNWGQPQQ